MEMRRIAFRLYDLERGQLDAAFIGPRLPALSETPDVETLNRQANVGRCLWRKPGQKHAIQILRLRDLIVDVEEAWHRRMRAVCPNVVPALWDLIDKAIDCRGIGILTAAGVLVLASPSFVDRLSGDSPQGLMFNLYDGTVSSRRRDLASASLAWHQRNILRQSGGPFQVLPILIRALLARCHLDAFAGGRDINQAAPHSKDLVKSPLAIHAADPTLRKAELRGSLGYIFKTNEWLTLWSGAVGREPTLARAGPKAGRGRLNRDRK